MRIGILSLAKKITYEEKRLRAEVKELGHKCRVYRTLKCSLFVGGDKTKVFYEDKTFPQCDFLFIRPNRIDPTGMSLFMVKQFELRGIPLINSSESILKARNKLRAAQILDHHGLPVSKTMMIHRSEDFELALKMVGGPPIIIKKIHGSYGNGVMIAETKRAAFATLQTLWIQDGGQSDFLIQEYVSESKGEDTRVIVVGDQVLGGIIRKARKGEFRSNLHQGGSSRPVEVSQEVGDICVKAVKALDLHIAGVDILQTKRGPVVMEVNANPGFEGFELTTGINVAKAMVKYSIDYAQRETEANHTKKSNLN